MSIKYNIPGMPDWTFITPSLTHKGGAGYTITPSTTPQEIIDGVKNILRGTTFTPDEAAFELVAQAATKVNWEAILSPYAVLTAPLLVAAAPTSASQTISTEQLDKFYENLKAVYFGLKASDPREKTV